MRRIWLSNGAQDLDRPFLYNLKADPAHRWTKGEGAGAAGHLQSASLRVGTERLARTQLRLARTHARTHERNETISRLKPSLRKLRLTFSTSDTYYAYYTCYA